MSIRAAKKEELGKLVELVSEAFQYGPDGRVNRDFPLLYSPANTGSLYVYEERDGILAHAGSYAARMKLEGGEIPVAGIGGVCTIPAAQGRGLASELVEACIHQGREQGAALAFLWTDKHDFYRKLGFELVGRQWCIELADEPLARLRKEIETQKKYFRCTKEKNEEFFSQSFLLHSAQVLGIIRSEAEHRALLCSDSCQVFSAWSGEKLVAYLVLGKGRDLSGYIHEWAGEEMALLSLLSQTAQESGAQFLLSPQFMPKEEAWIYRLDALGFPMEAQYVAMVKLLQLKPILSLLGAHLQGLGFPPSAMLIREQAGVYELEWRDSWKQKFTEPELLRFLFGPEMPEQQELAAVLPMRLWYWGMDSV